MQLRLLQNNDPIQAILKLPSDLCNMNCRYCYEKRRPYDYDRYLSPEVISKFLNTLGGRYVSVQLHGGEPLIIGIEKMREIIRALKKYEGKITLNIQTNAILLSHEWLNFFDEEWPNIELGISLDGDAYANSHRVDYNDRPLHEQVEKVLEICSERNRNVGIISVVNRNLLGRADQVLTYFSKFKCIRMINFTPCMDYNVNKPWKEKSNRQKSIIQLNELEKGIPQWATSPIEYADFIIDVFKVWRDRGFFNCFMIEPIFSAIRTLHKKQTNLCHFNIAKCTHIFTLYPDGTLGSCDELRMPDAYLAKIDQIEDLREINCIQKNHPLFARITQLLEICTNCPYEEVCRGGCISTRLNYQRTQLEREYCNYRAKMIDFIASEIGLDPINKPIP